MADLDESGLLARASDKFKDTIKQTASRASDKLKATASQATDSLKEAAKEAITAEKAKSALATKLMVGGLTMICLSGGVDYFSHDDDVHRALATASRDVGQDRLAAGIDWLDALSDRWKAGAISAVPEAVRDHAAAPAFVVGLILFVIGLRMKINASPGRHGTILREVGGIMAGPGLVMMIVFVYMSWHTPVVKGAFGSFFTKLFHGDMSGDTTAELARRYAPWAWGEVGTVLVLGLLAGVIPALAPFVRRKAVRWIDTKGPLKLQKLRVRVSRSLPEAEGIRLDATRRTLFTGAVLSIAYYAIATVVAIGSYGGALRIIAWPWKIDPGAFLAGLWLLALGLALFRTGTVEHRREEAEAEAKPARR